MSLDMSFESLHAELEQIDWDKPSATEEVAHLYADIGKAGLLNLVMDEWGRLEQPEHPKHQDYINFSRRKPTHIKYYFGGAGPNSTDSYSLWLHWYNKTLCPELGTGSYVENYHNQRYDFTSIILNQGYIADEVKPTQDPEISTEDFWLPTKDEWLPSEIVYKEGDIVTMRAAIDIHRLRNIGDKTMTLLTQGPARRHASQGFDQRGKVTAHYPDFVALFPDLVSQLSELPNGS